MPVPGQPRNPFGQTPDRFKLPAPRFVVLPGETPGTMEHTREQEESQGGGAVNIRHVWRQMVNYIGAGAGLFNWTNNLGPRGDDGANSDQVTRALRYKASTRYVGAGNFLLYGAARPLVPGRHAMRPVTTQAGNRQTAPTVRNRLTSFGSRVTPLNAVSAATEEG